jgi:hypothetical protein
MFDKLTAKGRLINKYNSIYTTYNESLAGWINLIDKSKYTNIDVDYNEAEEKLESYLRNQSDALSLILTDILDKDKQSIKKINNNFPLYMNKEMIILVLSLIQKENITLNKKSILPEDNEYKILNKLKMIQRVKSKFVNLNINKPNSDILEGIFTMEMEDILKLIEIVGSLNTEVAYNLVNNLNETFKQDNVEYFGKIIFSDTYRNLVIETDKIEYLQSLVTKYNLKYLII